jgi:hypothetical protein
VTGQDILTGAYSHNKKLAPGRIVEDATEGVQVINRVLAALFALGARLNPEFFGASADVAFNAGWARPADAELIYRHEMVQAGDPEGEYVRLVPFDDRGLAAGRPAVYRFGQRYFPAVPADGPQQADALRFYYAKRPAALAALADPIDPFWPEAHAELLMLEVAIYISLKDGQDVAGLVAQRDHALRLFVAFLQHEDTAEIRRSARTFVAPSFDSFLVAPTNAAG